MSYTEKESWGPSSDDDIGFSAAGENYRAVDFVPASSYTLTQLGIWLFKYNTPTGQLTVDIYSDSGTNPNASLGQATSTISEAGLPSGTDQSAATEQLVAFAGVALTSGTRYWVVLHTNDTPGSNRASIALDSSSQSNHVRDSVLGSIWTDIDGYGASAQGRFKTYTGSAEVSVVQPAGLPSDASVNNLSVDFPRD